MERSLAALAAGGLPTWSARQLFAAQEEGAGKKTSANDRLAMGIVGIGSPQSRSLQVVGESGPSVKSGELTFTLGCDVAAAHRKRATEVMRREASRNSRPTPRTTATSSTTSRSIACSSPRPTTGMPRWPSTHSRPARMFTARSR